MGTRIFDMRTAVNALVRLTGRPAQDFTVSENAETRTVIITCANHDADDALYGTLDGLSTMQSTISWFFAHGAYTVQFPQD